MSGVHLGAVRLSGVSFKQSILILAIAARGWAQLGGVAAGHGVILGELQIDGVEDGRDFEVELTDCLGSSWGIRGKVSSANRFEFDDVAPGCKMLRVVSGAQRSVVQEMQVFAGGAPNPLVVHIENRAKESTKGGIISADRLRHPLPHDVARALGDASQLSQSGRMTEARERLREISAKYPAIWEPHYNLGIAEMKLGNLTAALQEFVSVRAINPRFTAAAVASGFVLLQLGRLQDAESAANDAIALEPANPTAKLLAERIRAH